MANKPTQPVFPLGLVAEEQSTLAGILNTGTIEHGPDAVLTLPEGNASAGLPSSVRYNADSDEFEGFYENGGWLPLGGGGIRWEALPHASTATLTEGRGYLVDNSTGVSTVVFPSPTRIGDSVTVCDLYGKFSLYPLTIDPNGRPMYGSVEPMTLSTDSVSATFTWSGDARGWIVTAGVGLGQGRVYSRTIFTETVSVDTAQVTLTTQPSIVDVYVDGKRLLESKYSLNDYNVDFSPSIPSGSELQVIQYVPIQLGNGSGGSGGGTVITWIYNSGSAAGGETEIELDVDAEDVSEIFIDGSRQQKGLGFTYDSVTKIITLADELEAGDEVVVVINGDPTLYNQIDRTPNEVARSANVKDSEVILSSNTTQYLNGKKVVYDVVAQKIYGLPALPTNVYINSVSNGQLTYSPGNIIVDLLPVPNPVQDNLDAYKADLADASDVAKGDALITVKQPALNTISRTLHLMNADYINIKDWGAKGDGVTDDTDAIDKACAALTGSSFISNFRRIYMPHGTYIYNGTGIVLPNGTSLVGEDLFTVIDASSNTNSGYLIKLTGFRSRVSNLALYGNSANTGLVAISSSYNTNLGGVVDVIIQDFHNGIDIDKCWYAIYRGIQFRRSSGSVVLTGSHIRIGYNLPTEEVNNLDFSCIYLCEQQKHGVAIYCPTQVLSWNQCSFETIGEARIKFYTAANQNTFVLNDCYIEGNVGTSGGAYFVEGQNISQTISTRNCMFRLGSLAGSLGKNITIRDSNSWANCPNVTLNQNNTKVWASDYRSFIGGFADGIDPGRSGDYDGSGMYTAAVYMQPRVQDIRDWNSIIPATVNAKVFNTAGQTLNMWSVYLPATTNSQRIMQLTIDASYKRLSGSDQYNTQWVLSLTNNDLTGSVLTRVFENGTTNAGAGSLTLAIVADGYDAATDSAKFTLTITTATTGLVLAKLQGMHAESDTLGLATKRWRIQRR